MCLYEYIICMTVIKEEEIKGAILKPKKKKKSFGHLL